MWSSLRLNKILLELTVICNDIKEIGRRLVMENNMITKGKIAMFLLLCVILVFVYVVTLPTQSIHYKSYTFHLFGIIYTFVMLCSIMIIDTKKIAKKDYIVAVSLGLMSVGITSPINYMGILSSICTVFAYL